MNGFFSSNGKENNVAVGMTDNTGQPISNIKYNLKMFNMLGNASWEGLVRIDLAGNLCIMVDREYINALIGILSDYVSQNEGLIDMMKRGEQNG